MDHSAQIYFQLFRALSDRVHKRGPEPFSAKTPVRHKPARLVTALLRYGSARAFGDYASEAFGIFFVEIYIERRDEARRLFLYRKVRPAPLRRAVLRPYREKEFFANKRVPAPCQERALFFVVFGTEPYRLESDVSDHCPRSLTSTAFCACSLFSASSNISG